MTIKLNLMALPNRDGLYFCEKATKSSISRGKNDQKYLMTYNGKSLFEEQRAVLLE